MIRAAITPSQLQYIRSKALRNDYLESPSTENFVRAVWKDESGKHIILHELHRKWHEFIKLMRSKGVDRIGILAPYKYGKTPNILGEVLHGISLNRNLRCKIVCNDDFNAKKRVSTVKQYIEYDKDFKMLFGDYIKPYKDGIWTKNAIEVVRDSMSTDATLEAASVLSTGIGGTFDKIIFDDPCDYNNSVASVARRESVKEHINEVWLSRLDKGGEVVYIGTTWHEEDATHDLLSRPGWAWLLMRVEERLKNLEWRMFYNPY